MAMMGRSRLWVDENQMRIMEEFFTTCPDVQICRTRLLDMLVSGGLKAQRNGVAASKDFDYCVQRYWCPFVSDLYDSFMKFGLAVWGVQTVRAHLPSHRFSKKNKKGAHLIARKVQVPFVRPFGSYKIEIRFSQHAEVSYHLYSMSKYVVAASNEEDRSMQIFVLPRYAPTMNGELRAPLMPLVTRFTWLQDMRSLALSIERTHARPPFICESVPESKNPTDAVAIEMFGDGEALHQDEQDMYTRNRAAVEHLHRQRNMCSVLNGHSARDKTLQIDPFTGRVSKKAAKRNIWQESVFLLPQGQRMTTPLNPSARTDLTEMHTQFAESVCGAMGVPRSLLVQDKTVATTAGGSNAAGTLDLSYRIFMRNLDSTANTLLPYVQRAYTHIFADKCTFSFPYVPLIDMEQIILLAEMGVISRETLGRHMLAAAGLPPEEMQLQPDSVRDSMTLPEHVKPKPADNKPSGS